MLENLLSERGLMKIWDSSEICSSDEWEKRRSEILKLLCNEEYGFLPCTPDNLSFEVLEQDNKFCAGKVTLNKVSITAQFGNKRFSFPCWTSIPNGNKKYPFFVFINFRGDIPDKYFPTEEICDNGFAILSFCYEDVTSDDNNFSDGIAGVIYGGKDRKDNDCGKISMWSWAASRVMDYAKTLSNLDLTKAFVVGHSRLGKTALLTGALDARFACAISNDSGCSGAAITRGKRGEKIKDIYNSFPYWFCANYKKYMDNEHNLPFDQHFLLAAIAPRKVYVASAKEDLWADPDSEYLSCVAASEVYEKLGFTGFVHPDRLPNVGDVFHEGNIGYHMRDGLHYLSREDWLHFIAYLKKQFKI
ncbi:alpha/beta hydrolase [Pseudoclostridium thermosuccinogenes]|uniref:alpha/beta hydrolase family protein n=1 Tax=Clostridium thermosuccinogenes TaxID=84032 RepID=UPI002FD9D71A